MLLSKTLPGWLLPVGAIVLLALAAGCTPANPVPVEVRAAANDRFKLDSPSSVMSVAELRELLESPGDPTATTAGESVVTVFGVVGGITNPFGGVQQPDFPCVAGEAKLFLVDAAVAASAHQHTDPNHQCAFCESHAKEHANKVAIVEFRNDSGEVIPYRASDLLAAWPVDAGSKVVVQGQAKMVLDSIVVTATGIALQ
jgi:hypothetical protein